MKSSQELETVSK